MDIVKVINNLKANRKIFYSENDFQFALAWEIQKCYKKAKIRLERCRVSAPKKDLYVDIIVHLNNKEYPIELKYKTKALEVTENNEEYSLRNQGAQNFGRYDYLKDIQRLEELSKKIKNYGKGFAILLTNDELYWVENREGADNEKFYLSQGKQKTKTMNWGTKASNGTTKNRKNPIKLSGKYEIDWKDYSKFKSMKNGEFKYCLNII